MHTPVKSVYIGALILVTAEALFAGVGGLIKYLSETLNQSQLIFFRNLFAMLVLLPWVAKGKFSLLNTGRLGLHFFRALTGLTGMYCFFYMLANLPLTSAVLALKIAPFFIPVIAHYWLKEAISVKSVVAIGVGFIGVLFILDLSNQNPEFKWAFAAVGLCCALLVATTKCTLSKLSDTEPAIRIVFYFTSLSTVVSFPIMVLYWQPIPSDAWWLIVIMSSLAVVGQLLMTKAYQYASPVKIGLLGYSSVVFAAVLGTFFWQQNIGVNLAVGMIFLLWAGNMTLRQKWGW
ncbi:MAG: drug/metabolite transporter (DMT)-like permease [Alphaproteobacteria bacterium]|jgi:drug/metabolite transporter (DMT)-like permease